MKLYFAYGANLNIAGMQYRCPNAKRVRSFDLHDWRLSFSSVATIQPAPGETVSGALWELTEACERSLDTFEGWPTLYRKEVIISNGQEIMVYVMNQDAPCEPNLGYLMTIAEGYQDWDLNLDNLWQAVRTTQEECYDLHWSTRSTSGESNRNVQSSVQLESSDDVRWLCNLGYTNTDVVDFQQH